MKETLEQVMSNPKVAVTVGTGTAGVGTGHWFHWIPNDVGKFGVAVGAILSLVLIVIHIRKSHLERKKIKMELELLQNKLDSTTKPWE